MAERTHMKVVYDDKLEGLRTISSSMLTGKAYAFPRNMWYRVSNDPKMLLNRPCVYVLWGNTSSGLRAYVGKTDNFAVRATDHIHKKRDFWVHTAAFTADGLNTGYVEKWLQHCAIESNVCKLDGKPPPAKSKMESDYRNMEEKDVAEKHLKNARQFFLPLAGCDFFNLEPDMPAKGAASQSRAKTKAVLLRLRARGVIANGYETESGGIKILKKSQAVKEHTPSMLPGDVQDREALKSKGVLEDHGDIYQFSRDHVFDSPSKAAKMVLGRPSNGLNEWKTWPDGETLKELRSSRRP